MTEAMTEALKEAYTLCPTSVAVLNTIELSHPSIVGSRYFVQNRAAMTLTLEDHSSHLFTAASFQLTLPARTDEGVQDLELSICNIGREVSDFLLTAVESSGVLACKYRPYLSNDLTAPAMSPPLVLSLSDIQITTYEVRARASFADLVNKKFPSELYLRRTFPSLGGG